MADIADARCAERWWKDERIKKRFARWGGGAGRKAAEAGLALLRYISNADDYNLGFVAKRMNLNMVKMRDVAKWAYWNVPHALEPWVGALLLAGVPPEAIKEKFVDWRQIKSPEAQANEECLSWEQPH